MLLTAGVAVVEKCPYSECSTSLIIFPVSCKSIISFMSSPDQRTLDQASPCCYLLVVMVERRLGSITSRSWMVPLNIA